MSFKDLKKQSQLGALTEKLVKSVEKMNSGSSKDLRFWKPTMTKEGIGSAIIRFLPPVEGEENTWEKLYSHSFKGPTGQWYIENSLTTLDGQKDPVSDYNRSLVNQYTDDGDLDKCPQSVQNKVRQQKRKLSFISNIYVIKDPANPENEGKVFLFKYGKKIFDKILAAMDPEFDDEESINPFDFWKGANFKLKLVKKDGYWNYDKSEFASVSPLFDDDEAMEAVWKKQYPLSPFVASDQFKTYAELEKRMNLVLNLTPTSSMHESRLLDDDLESNSKSESYGSQVMEELEDTYKKAKAAAPVEESSDEDDEDDDTLSYFKKLAED